MARNSKSGATKRFYFLRLPADHEKSDTSDRLIHWAKNEGYGLYIRLLEKAVPKTGFIEFTGIEKSIEEQLAYDLKITLDQTRTLLDTLKRLGLAEPAGDESKDLFFREAYEYTRTETAGAQRQQRYVAKKRNDGEASRNDGEASRNDGEASRNDGEASRNDDNNIYNNSYNNNYKNSYNAEIKSILSAYPTKERQANARIAIEQRIEEGEEPEKLLNAAKMYSLELETKGADTFRIYPDNFYKKNGKYLSYKDMKPDEVTRYAKQQEPEKRQPNNKNPFRNFQQRTYDYKALEAQLLGSPNEGAADKEETGNDYP